VIRVPRKIDLDTNAYAAFLAAQEAAVAVMGSGSTDLATWNKDAWDSFIWQIMKAAVDRAVELTEAQLAAEDRQIRDNLNGVF
jgi:hypothetical protein